MRLSRRARKRLICLVAVYLLFDVRPLLLLPNAILYFRSKNYLVDEEKRLQINVFPKLTVGGDPVTVVFSETNISAHFIETEDIFGRSYDRSGMFAEFQLSGTFNSRTDAETLYLLLGGLGGGLSGGPARLAPGSQARKALAVNDYMKLSRAGQYRIRFKYLDFGPGAAGKEYDLKEFLVVRLPENYISSTVRSAVFAAAAIIPYDRVRVWAVKHLGYQETWLSTYVLARYHCANYEGWEEARFGTRYRYNNSMSDARKGIVRNGSVSKVNGILRKFQGKYDEAYSSLNELYLSQHFDYYLFGGIEDEVARERIALLMGEMFVSYDNSQKAAWENWWMRVREGETDQYLIDKIETEEQQALAATNASDRVSHMKRKEYWEDKYNNKQGRAKTIRLIDFMIATAQGM